MVLAYMERRRINVSNCYAVAAVTFQAHYIEYYALMITTKNSYACIREMANNFRL